MCAFPGAVLVVAPPTLHRQGLLLVLQQAWPHLDVVLTADGSRAPTLLRRQAYQLVIVDRELAEPPLLRLLAQLRRIRANQHLLLLTGAGQAPELPLRLRGIESLVALASYPAAPEAILTLIRQQLPDGPVPVPAEIAPARPGSPPTPFSPRELEVLRLVMTDYSNQQIAEQLCLSVRTVESHRRALLQKTGTRSLVGLVVQAVRAGWVPA